MTYEETILALVGLQQDCGQLKEMDIHILPLFTRVDIRNRLNGSVRTVTMERTSNFTDILCDVIYELNHG